jgi:hypothetical protein
MRKLLTGLFAIVFTMSASAQTKDESKIKFNVGLELGLATGILKEVYSIGLGATAQLEYGIDDNLSVTANSGIIQYVGRKIPGTTTKYLSSATIPLLVGGKYMFSDNFFGTLQIGTSIFSGVNKGSNFTYIPGLGFNVNDKISALVKYTGYSSYGGAFGVRVSYNL